MPGLSAIRRNSNRLTQVSCAPAKDPDSDIDPNRGLLPIDEIPCKREPELSSMLLNPVDHKQQKQLITDEILQNNNLGWPERQQKPFYEFKLATMAFP